MNNYLFSFKLRKIFGSIFFASIIIGVYFLIFSNFLNDDNLKITPPNFLNFQFNESNPSELWFLRGKFDEMLSIIIILSGIVFSFSKTKIENDFVKNTRIKSLFLTVYVNYLILLLAIIFVNGSSFISILIYNMFSFLLIFNLIFLIKKNFDVR